jgi:hypothetical protein
MLAAFCVVQELHNLFISPASTEVSRPGFLSRQGDQTIACRDLHKFVQPTQKQPARGEPGELPRLKRAESLFILQKSIRKLCFAGSLSHRITDSGENVRIGLLNAGGE